MTQGQLLAVQGLLMVVMPYVIWRLSGCRQYVPLVVVQIAAGIVLGPSVLGRITPNLHFLLFDPGSLERLSGIASLGVLIFGFVTGLHLNIRELTVRPYSFSVVAIVGLIVPLGLGIATGVYITAEFPSEIGPSVTPLQFALAIGVCCAVTALPVLSAIVRETQLVHTILGQWSLGIAAITDAVLWLILAVFWSTNAEQGRPHLVIFEMISFFLLHIAVLIFIVKPVLERFLTVAGIPVLLLAVVFGSSLVTEMIGLHYILGAFLSGAIVPLRCRDKILEQCEPLIVLLMPFFFMTTGLKTSIDLGSSSFIVIFLLATSAAVVGKTMGTAVPLRLLGWSWKDAVALGALLQTKGLMEIVILRILLDAQVITRTAFSALVLMAICSTALAIPLMRLALRRNQAALSVGGSVNSAAG